MWDFTKKEVYTFREFYIPFRMMDSLQRYIEDHVKPGDFLSAVISNDLRSAVVTADDENIYLLPTYIGFFYNEAPVSCWGSKETFKTWLSIKPKETYESPDMTGGTKCRREPRILK